MPTTRVLLPEFLLPAWDAHHVRQLRIFSSTKLRVASDNSRSRAASESRQLGPTPSSTGKPFDEDRKSKFRISRYDPRSRGGSKASTRKSYGEINVNRGFIKGNQHSDTSYDKLQSLRSQDFGHIDDPDDVSREENNISWDRSTRVTNSRIARAGGRVEVEDERHNEDAPGSDPRSRVVSFVKNRLQQNDGTTVLGEKIREFITGYIDHSFESSSSRVESNERKKTGVDPLKQLRQDRGKIQGGPEYPRGKALGKSPGKPSEGFPMDTHEHKPRTTPDTTSKRQPVKDLLEELFPEEARKREMIDKTKTRDTDLPRLPFSEFEDSPNTDRDQPSKQTKSKLTNDERLAAQAELRQRKTTVLVFGRASTALSEADFTRVIPRGQHIGEWRTVGDIVTVIPGRDHRNLKPKTHYFLIFDNPKFARAYSDHVRRIHRLAMVHTPTSLHSRMALTDGKLIKGENVAALLNEYALYPPSQKLDLRVLHPPYKSSLSSLLNEAGYGLLSQTNDTEPTPKAGRSVLFWVNGYQPTTFALHTMLSKDGSDRGLQWGPLRGTGSIKALDDSQESENESENTGDSENRKRVVVQRWVLSFEDEAEARRFVRVWQRRPWPYPLRSETRDLREPDMLCHVEFLW